MNKLMIISNLIFLLLSCSLKKEDTLPNYDAKLLSITQRSLLAYMDGGLIYNSRHQVIAKFSNDTLANNQGQSLGYITTMQMFTMDHQQLGLLENNHLKNRAGQTIAYVEGHESSAKVGLAISMFFFFLND